MRATLLDHAARYLKWEIPDIYKLIHQAAMGSEHAAADECAARAWLLRELREMGPGTDEPLIDPISPDHSIVRVHLRPFARMGLDAEMLLAAFLRTAREFRGSAPRLERGLEDAAQLAGEGLIAADPAEIELLAARMKASGYRAVHHSAAYVDAYRPAYRVAAREFLPTRMLSRNKGYGGHDDAARDP
jgi:hypothetical protein